MKGYRTLAFNGGLAALLTLLVTFAEVVQEFGYSKELQYFISDENMPYLMIAILIANIILRLVTTTPVGKR